MTKNITRKTAVILTVGSELLKGSTLNTNARFLGQRLLAAGFRVREQLSCDDVIEEIQTCLAGALKVADLVIVSGGLGPTPDDVTRDAIAGFFNKPLISHPLQKQRIVRLYARLRKNMPPSVLCEALYPKTAIPLLNRYGIALGFCMSCRKKRVIVLPGVPRELENLIDHHVMALLRKSFPGIRAKCPLIIKTIGLSEPTVMEKLGSDFFDRPFEFGIYPHPGEVTLRIYCDTEKTRSLLDKKIQTRLKGYIYANAELNLSEVIGRRLKAKKMRLGVAESCTGGQLSAEFTRYPGASDYFQGGLIAYDDRVKIRLGIAKKILRRHGAVSAPVASGLAAAAMQATLSQWGVGITGIAGPTGGTREKPVGTVYVAVRGPRNYHHVERCEFWGSRDHVQRKAVTRALELLWRALE